MALSGGVWVVFGGGLLGQHFGFAALHIAGQLRSTLRVSCMTKRLIDTRAAVSMLT